MQGIMTFVTEMSLCALLILAFSSLALCSSSCNVKFKNCDESSHGTLYKMQVNTTCDGESVILKKGTTVKINFTFSAVDEESKLTSEVFGKISFLPDVPFPLENPDACKNSGISCPIQPKKKYNYLPLLEIKPSYPAVSVRVKWELQDSDKNNIFCIEVEAKIES